MFAVLAVSRPVLRHAVLVVYRDYIESDVQRLLDELCIKLGVCLAEDAVRRIEESPPGDVDSFTDAVFEAGGWDDMTNPEIRSHVREVVDRHMGRWAAAVDQRGDDHPSGEGWWSPH
jgi:hypothetical protein